MEKDSYALFVDNSGSVGGSIDYWGTVQTIINQYAKDISHYYLWNSTCGKTSKKEIENWIASKKGTGGTSPEHVATTIVQEKLTHVILVTDGEVGDHSVQSCDKQFENALNNIGFKISKSVCYIISTGYGDVNMSVTCPFSRFCESKIFTKNKGEEVKAVVSYSTEDFKILDSL